MERGDLLIRAQKNKDEAEEQIKELRQTEKELEIGKQEK